MWFFNKKPSGYFIAIYTNVVKDYCDQIFFERVKKISGGNPVHIVDNTPEPDYFKALQSRYSKYDNFHFYHLNVDREPVESLFHRRVTSSVLLLREKFLEGDLPYFLIIESDVIAPRTLLTKFEYAIKHLDKVDKKWGIVGGLYHRGWHNYKLSGLQKTHHVLSGCTVYKRSLIEKYPFRWSMENIGAFPDAWISLDAKQDFGLYDDHKIECAHLENKKTNTRYSGSL